MGGEPVAAASAQSNSRFLRNPLRSKSLEQKPTPASNSADKRRKGPASSVSKSVGVLDLSDNAAKPPRQRLSAPSKSSTSPKSVRNLAPISEARAKQSSGNKTSETSQRRKFSVLSSASYWLTQIKLSESAAKHSISLGFFNLALQAGSEPLQRMNDALKAYLRRHNLSELGETVKEVLESYKVSENMEHQSQNSEVAVEGNHLSNPSSSFIKGAGKMKLKSWDLNSIEGVRQVKKPKNKINDKYNAGKQHTKKTMHKHDAHSKSSSEVKRSKTQMKPQKYTREDESCEEIDKVKKQGHENARDEGPLDSTTEDGCSI